MRHIEAQRIVVKIGTSTLTHSNGKLNLQAIDQLCYSLSGLVNDGKEIVLVSSGAIGVGLGQLGIKSVQALFQSNKHLQRLDKRN